MGSGGIDWGLWLLAAGVTALMVAFFVFVGTTAFTRLRRLIGLIDAWPQIRRARVAAEARAGGRHPFWLRAARGLVLIALAGVLTIIIWRRFI
ncbi:hypothetical protein [Devosia sp.]|uniref:hypothetical protein n=1 Tax=Devosia sp. TaxID=1871048 RepID=UPI003A8CEE39